MSIRYFAVGIFILAGLSLFALGIFLVGNRHQAFSHHVLLYTEFSDLDGIAKGSKVQVAGMDAGQVTKVEVPRSPDGHFRVQMKVDEQLHGLIRTDSMVTVDTEGVVGNTFLTIHSGSPNAEIAKADDVLASKPPISMSDLLSHGMGLMNDADTSIKQLGDKLSVALDGVNGTMGNANEILVGLKEGRGPAGMLLRDEKMASQIRETISSVQATSSNLNQASVRVNSLVADVQQRKLTDKVDDTLTQVHSASVRANSTIEQVQQSLAQALGPDANGVTAGQNINEALSNVNVATGNMAEDTEALKHSLFFRGFFKHRGYYALGSLTPEEYRRNKLFGNTQNHRVWLQANELFEHGPHDSEILSSSGKHAIDAAVASLGDSVLITPIVIEGYSDAAVAPDALSWSYTRAQLVRNYLEARYPFTAQKVGVMPLSAMAPVGVGHDHWSGVCIVAVAKK